jgi:hypothetical protein
VTTDKEKTTPRDDIEDDKDAPSEEPSDNEEPNAAEDDQPAAKTSSPPPDDETSTSKDENLPSEEAGAATETSTIWAEKIESAQKLWEAGNNAELRKLLDEMAKAPAEEQAVHELVVDMRKRLEPDPIAIGLWVVTLAVFCLLTYLYVLR